MGGATLNRLSNTLFSLYLVVNRCPVAHPVGYSSISHFKTAVQHILSVFGSHCPLQVACYGLVEELQKIGQDARFEKLVYKETKLRTFIQEPGTRDSLVAENARAHSRCSICRYSVFTCCTTFGFTNVSGW